MSIRLTLPLPPKQLHAHAKGHWRAKHGPTKQCRERAYVEAIAAGITPLQSGELCCDFYWPDLRPRDTANALQSVKPYIDGLIDAGVLPDDNWRVMSIGHVRSHLDRENPRVELEVRANTPAPSSNGKD